MQGGLYIDRTGVWNYNLVVCTNIGKIYTVGWNPANTSTCGTVTLIGDAKGIHLEGIVTIPNNATVWGDLAGRILAGAENEGKLWAVGTDLNLTSYSLNEPFNIEDMDWIEDNENFFGVAYGIGRILGVSYNFFKPYVGKVMLTQGNSS